MFQDTPVYQFRGPWNVPVQIGFSLLILFLLFADFQDVLSLKYSVAYIGILVLSIFLHEVGHAWGALVQGVGVRRIMIHGGGGFCEHAPSTRYEDELIIAMGTLTNLGIWAITSLLAPFAGSSELSWLLYATADLNLFLALFNLIPVFPLDGGRLLHLALCRMMGPDAAGRISGAVGLLMIAAWIPFMLTAYFILGFVLIFIPPLLMHWRLLRGDVAA